MKLGIRGLFVALGLVILSVLLLSCGGDDDDGTSPTTPSAASPTSAPSGGGGGAATLSVTIANLAYSPRTLTVRAGQAVTVSIQNNDSFTHTMTIQNGPSSGNIGGGSSGTLTFTAPAAAGGMNFFCQIHGQGMSGTITVQ